MNKFKEREVLEELPIKTKTNGHKKCMRIQSGLEQVSEILSGLKGGAPSINANLGKYSTNNDLQLINRGSDCFVNCVIQLLRCTPYVKFMKVHLPDLIANTSPDSYRVSKRLYYIYNDFVGPKSVAYIRTHVAQMSGKRYLDNNTQQDAEEFFRALEAVLNEELIDSEEFKAVRYLHWGKEQITRKFVDNTSQGTCPACGKLPSETEFPFLFLKLNNLPRATSVTLSALVHAYLSEGTETMEMRCQNCCDNLNHGSACPMVGRCKSRKTVEKCKIIKHPKYLFIQLVRNVWNAPKVTTFVKIENQLVIQNEQIYEVIATVDHIGSSPVKLQYRGHLELDFQILIFGNGLPFPNTLYRYWKFSSKCQYLEI